jgi:hypothetical protein
MMPQPITPVSSSFSFDITKLGYYLDGWADLVEDKGNQAEQIRLTVQKILQERNMPQVRVTRQRPMVGAESRDYESADTYPGAVTTVYVGEHGKDLYVSWRTFIKPVLNQNVIVAILLVAGILGLFSWFSTNSFFWAMLSFVLFGALAAAFVGFLGRMLKGSSVAFFFIEPNLFDAEDITAMSLSVHKSLLRALDKEGIDTSQLRLKQSFKGGRREEDI